MDPGGPSLRPPCLDDPLRGDEFHVDSREVAPVTGERTADLAGDARGFPCELRVLLLADERVVDLPWRRADDHTVPDVLRHGGFVVSCRLPGLRVVLRAPVEIAGKIVRKEEIIEREPPAPREPVQRSGGT